MRRPRTDGGTSEHWHSQIKGLDERHGVTTGGAAEHAANLFAHAFAADASELTGVAPNRGLRCRFDGQVESSGKSHSAKDAEIILGKALIRIANSAKQARDEVGNAADVIDDQALRSDVERLGKSRIWRGKGIEEDGVDGEITPLGIGDGVAEGDRIWAAAVGIVAIGAKGGDLDHARAALDDDHPEGSADQFGAGKELMHAIGRGIGGDVIILGIQA